LQKLTAQKISDITGIECGKDCDIESRPMGQSGTDVILRGEAKKLFPFSVECKAQESWSIPAWIKQAQANEMVGTDWLLVAKRSREKPVIIMDMDTFFGLMKAVIGDVDD